MTEFSFLRTVLPAVVTTGGILSLLFFVVSCQAPPSQEPLSVNETLFVSHVKPVLEHRCSHCHNSERPMAALNVLSREIVLTGKSIKGQRFVTAGTPDQSLIFLALTQPQSHPGVMPGDGWGLTEAETQQFEAWIRGGAEWPTGSAGKLKKREYRVETEGDL